MLRNQSFLSSVHAIFSATRSLGLGSGVALGLLACSSQEIHDSRLHPQTGRAEAASPSHRCPAGDMRCRLLFDADPKPLRPNGRLVMELQDLGDQLREASGLPLVKQMTTERMRLKFLHLQAIVKIYSGRDLDKKQAKRLARFGEVMKEVEGVIGEYMRRTGLRDIAIKGGAPPDVVRQLETYSEEMVTKSDADFRRIGWGPDPLQKLDELINEVGDFDLGSGKKDQLVSVKGMRDLVKEEREDVEAVEKYIKLQSYGEEDLDRGLHKMRRDLRWIINSMVAMEGFFNSPPSRAAEDQDFESKYGSVKYLHYSVMPGIDPVVLDRRAVLQVAMLVTELGALKDFKEAELDYAEFLVAKKLAPNDVAARAAAHTVMTKSFAKDVEVEKEAQAFYAYYLKANPLKQIKRDLDRAVEALSR